MMKNFFNSPLGKTISSVILALVIFVAIEYQIYSKADKLDEFTFLTVIKDGGVFIPTFIAWKAYQYFKNKS